MSETGGINDINEAYREQQQKIDSMVESMGAQDDPVWKEKAGKYLREIDRYQAMVKLLDIGSKALNEKREMFVELCENPEFEIAFVGTIKTGKSTLINALLGHDYTPTDITPETAALTKFRKSDNDYIRIIFYSKEEWEELKASKSQNAVEYNEFYERLGAESVADRWIGHDPIRKELSPEEIEKAVAQWTSSKYAEHFFVKEVEMGISSLPDTFPPQVLFVDTPGLFDAVQYRSEIAEKYIRNADAVFFCIDAQRTIREEHDEIQVVFQNSSENKSKVHIIATHWDKLNKPIEENWKKQKKFFVELFSNRNFFNDEDLAEKNIMHSSAYMYNLCKDFDNNIDELEMFTRVLGLTRRGDDDDTIRSFRDEIMRVSNVEKIKTAIEQELVMKYKQLMMERMEKVYQELIETYRKGIHDKKTALEGGK